jgi:hypothetical protein
MGWIWNFAGSDCEESYILLAGFLCGLLFTPDVGGSKLLRNVGKLLD